MVVVPVHAYPVLHALPIPRRIDLGSAAPGTTTTRSVVLESRVPVAFEFALSVIRASPAIAVAPLSGTVPGNGSVTVTFSLSPADVATFQAELEVNCSQFDFSPYRCLVVGRGAVGAAAEQEAAEAAKRLAASTGRVPRSVRQRTTAGIDETAPAGQRLARSSRNLASTSSPHRHTGRAGMVSAEPLRPLDPPTAPTVSSSASPLKSDQGASGGFAASERKDRSASPSLEVDVASAQRFAGFPQRAGTGGSGFADGGGVAVDMDGEMFERDPLASAPSGRALQAIDQETRAAALRRRMTSGAGSAVDPAAHVITERRVERFRAKDAEAELRRQAKYRALLASGVEEGVARRKAGIRVKPLSHAHRSALLTASPAAEGTTGSATATAAATANGGRGVGPRGQFDAAMATSPRTAAALLASEAELDAEFAVHSRPIGTNDIVETADGVRLPRDTSSHHTVGFVLTQREGTLKPADLRKAVTERRQQRRQQERLRDAIRQQQRRATPGIGGGGSSVGGSDMDDMDDMDDVDAVSGADDSVGIHGSRFGRVASSATKAMQARDADVLMRGVGPGVTHAQIMSDTRSQSWVTTALQAAAAAESAVEAAVSGTTLSGSGLATATANVTSSAVALPGLGAEPPTAAELVAELDGMPDDVALSFAGADVIGARESVWLPLGGGGGGAGAGSVVIPSDSTAVRPAKPPKPPVATPATAATATLVGDNGSIDGGFTGVTGISDGDGDADGGGGGGGGGGGSSNDDVGTGGGDAWGGVPVECLHPLRQRSKCSAKPLRQPLPPRRTLPAQQLLWRLLQTRRNFWPRRGGVSCPRKQSGSARFR